MSRCGFLCFLPRSTCLSARDHAHTSELLLLLPPCVCMCCSGLLVRHARRVLGVAAEVLNQPGRPRVMKACKEVCTFAFIWGELGCRRGCRCSQARQCYFLWQIALMSFVVLLWI